MPLSLDSINATTCSYVLSFIHFCARKLLLSTVIPKFIVIHRIFSTKLYSHEMFGSREFRTIFEGRAKKYLRTPDIGYRRNFMFSVDGEFLQKKIH